ncbi:hypothetical protein GUITHDRAFT_155400 [Guillardia theta CCMP2712]|uniref:Uncharacterized protein n=2 Tax=Guillardia theta TaxID=55529 RepID=L1IIF4_GUITC|nr:hypothetical protein GUITHDRAFT_155400 [Guillardia theta CCMP2712]EKX35714.1 hypothetical protein GUITHDRAFT_155400 [Guillardia theta CCMP2712]|eukprot:XP_005822694.1 hypothetical protein GUITHDRAFT_155400 [Guillardia theta CCMP2712]
MNDAGKLDSTRVIFLHDHPDQVETNKISFLSSEGLVSTLELTDWHAVSSEVTCTGRNNCGIRLMYGHEMKRGHGIVRRNGDSFDTARVISIERGLSRVRYIVTGNDRLVVNQALGIVYSTALASLESLPFRFLFWLSPTLLSHPATRKSLETVLESPALRAAEMLFNHLVGMLPAWKQGSQSGSELMAGRTRSNELES